MKIYNSINYNKLFLLEDIYGKQGIVYHRTKHLDLLENIKTGGFKSGDGAMYGTGVYFCYDIKSQFQKHNISSYGEYLIKSRINLDKFLVFDYFIAKRVYGKNYTLIDQLESLYKIKIDDLNILSISSKLENIKYSSDIAYNFSKYAKYTKFYYSNVQGIIYTGNQDGKAGVIFEPYLIHPISYTTVASYNDILDKNNWIEIKNAKLLSNFRLKLSQSWDKNIININKYDEVEINNYNYKKVKLNNKWGLLNDNGKEIVKPMYDDIEDLDILKNSVVKLNGKKGLIDVKNNFIIKPIYKDIYKSSINNNDLIYLPVIQIDNNNSLYFFNFGIIDSKGNIISKPLYNNIIEHSNSYLWELTIKDKIVAYFNTKTKKIIKKGLINDNK